MHTIITKINKIFRRSLLVSLLCLFSIFGFYNYSKFKLDANQHQIADLFYKTTGISFESLKLNFDKFNFKFTFTGISKKIGNDKFTADSLELHFNIYNYYKGFSNNLFLIKSNNSHLYVSNEINDCYEILKNIAKLISTKANLEFSNKLSITFRDKKFECKDAYINLAETKDQSHIIAEIPEDSTKLYFSMAKGNLSKLKVMAESLKLSAIKTDIDSFILDVELQPDGNSFSGNYFVKSNYGAINGNIDLSKTSLSIASRLDGFKLNDFKSLMDLAAFDQYPSLKKYIKTNITSLNPISVRADYDFDNVENSFKLKLNFENLALKVPESKGEFSKVDGSLVLKNKAIELTTTKGKYNNIDFKKLLCKIDKENLMLNLSLSHFDVSNLKNIFKVEMFEKYTSKVSGKNANLNLDVSVPFKKPKDWNFALELVSNSGLTVQVNDNKLFAKDSILKFTKESLYGNLAKVDVKDIKNTNLMAFENIVFTSNLITVCGQKQIIGSGKINNNDFKLEVFFDEKTDKLKLLGLSSNLLKTNTFKFENINLIWNESKPTTVAFHSKQADGQLSFSKKNKEDIINISFNHLNLNAVFSNDSPLIKNGTGKNLSFLNNIYIICSGKNLKYKNYYFNDFKADIYLNDNKLNIDSGVLKTLGGSINYNFEQISDKEYKFYGKTQVTNSKRLAKSLDLKFMDINSASGEIDFNLTFNEFAFDKVKGDLIVKLYKGKIIGIEPGIGRLAGLFNIYNLGRRLTLDFSDATSDGMAFDSLSLTSTIDNGVLNVDDLSIKAPAADLALYGKVDFVQDVLDLKCSVGSKIGGTLTLPIALINPALGAALLVFDQAVGSGGTRPLDQKYLIMGTMASPELLPVKSFKKK